MAQSSDALDLLGLGGNGEEWIRDALAWISIAEPQEEKSFG
jgi:hypothetical protein